MMACTEAKTIIEAEVRARAKLIKKFMPVEIEVVDSVSTKGIERLSISERIRFLQ